MSIHLTENQKTSLVIKSFKDLIRDGGNWVFIEDVNEDFSLKMAEEPIATFNLYSFIKENYGVSLNALTVDKFLEDNPAPDLKALLEEERLKNMSSSENEYFDEAPTGFLDEGYKEKKFALYNGEKELYIYFTPEEQSIGRSTAVSMVTLQDDKASRLHCYIRVIEGVPQIKDNNSTNGVFVNNSRIESGFYTSLNEEDSVQIGKTVFKLKVY